MINKISFYYNFYIDNLDNDGDDFYFYYNNNLYYLYLYQRDLSYINDIDNMTRYLHSHGILVHKLIANMDGQLITKIDEKYYVLTKIQVHKYEITINDLMLFYNVSENFYTNTLISKAWNQAWSEKIDYIEYAFNQLGSNFNILYESLGYFIGLAENAISYIKNTNDETKPNYLDKFIIAHHRIENDSYSFYNPLNFIYDHPARDLSEFLKLLFIKKIDISIINIYFQNIRYSDYGIRMLYGRMLYFTKYFDLFEKILFFEKWNIDLYPIIHSVIEYQSFLIYLHASFEVKIPQIELLRKIHHPDF